MEQNMTSRQLIEYYLELEIEKKCLEDDESIEQEEKTDTLDSMGMELELVKSDLRQKTDQIDSFTLELDRQQGMIKGEIDSIKEELARLNKRKKIIERSTQYFKEDVLPMIIETCGKDGVLKTDIARYKLYEAYGPIEIVDEDRIPEEYKRTKIEIDKKKARPAVIKAHEENGLGIAGFAIHKRKRVRKT